MTVSIIFLAFLKISEFYKSYFSLSCCINHYYRQMIIFLLRDLFQGPGRHLFGKKKQKNHSGTVRSDIVSFPYTNQIQRLVVVVLEHLLK